MVSGWFRGEFAAIGEHWLDHDERYRRSEEFIRSLRGIWTEDNFTFRGDFYRFNNYALKPKPIDPLPETFQGGSSRAARDMASRVSDWYFTNGNTPEEIGKQVADIREKAAALGRKVKIGVNAFGIARPTEQEARAVVSEIIAQANPDAVNAFAHKVKNAGKASPEGSATRRPWRSTAAPGPLRVRSGHARPAAARQPAELCLNLGDGVCQSQAAAFSLPASTLSGI